MTRPTQLSPRTHSSVRFFLVCALAVVGSLALFVGPALAAPRATTGPPRNPTQTSGTLTGTVDPLGGAPVTACHFEYGLKAGEYSLGTLECVPRPPLSASTAVTAQLDNLIMGTAYHYRLVAESTEGISNGEDETFTPSSVLELTTDPPTDLTPESAVLNGSWIGNGEDTHYRFEWGATTGYGNATTPAPGVDAGSGSGVQSGVFELTGLEPETTYHYRIVANNSKGRTVGADQVFETTGVPIFSFSTGPSSTQAGGHPDTATLFAFGTRSVPKQGGEGENRENECGCEDMQRYKVSAPAGVGADPHATPQCTRVAFGVSQCPPSTQVGWAPIIFSREGNRLMAPVYNLEPTPDQAGLLGFNAPLIKTPIYIVISARTGGDYGLDLTTTGLEHLFAFNATGLNLWGVPAESSHDIERAPAGSPGCVDTFPCFAPNPSSSERIPFIDNPTSCGEPLSSSLEIEAYNDGTTYASTPWPATTGCDQLSFNPSLYAQPTTKQADSPSGLNVDLSVPQSVSPTQPAPSEIRALAVKLPKGMSINPNAADGKGSCSDLEARFGTEEESHCPEFSKVGTATLASSALPTSIPGSIYIGDPQSNDRYRLILTANGFATHVKLAGSVKPEPQTGQLVASFPNLPQSPFSEFNLHFFGSERGLLATPTQCGTYPVESTFTPWDSALAVQTSTQYFKIEEGPGGGSCPPSPRSFNPAFTAGVSDSTAGAHTPFSLELTRSDGDQNLSALNVTTPPGFSATLKGIPYCSATALAAAANAGYSGLEEQANPSCPTASQIGTAQAGSGAGDHPVYLPGNVYLAGPYKGAPLSLAVITPAVSGPYDLGNVVVRAALQVNPETAQITAVSDPIPQILQGIPLRLRSIRINLDRSNFVLNPTNCDPFSVNAEVFGNEGAVAHPSAHFQVANCRVLPFAPKLTTRLTGSTKHTGYPSLHTVLTYPKGAYANIARVTATLPHSEFLANGHIKSPCTLAQFSAGKVPGEACPPGSHIGYAKVETPLLEAPLEGQVYLRTAPGRHIPDIVAALNGQIDIALVGHVESVPGRLRTTFETIPDAPVSKFTLTLDGGSKGLLETSLEGGLCSATEHVNVQITGQNGKTANQNPVLRVPCAKKKRKRLKASIGHRAERSL